MDFVVEQGTVVTLDCVALMDISVTEGAIAQLAESGTLNPSGAERIDADGAYVFPGLIDSHVHAKLSLGEFTTVDGFDDLTKAAAFGGTTTTSRSPYLTRWSHHSTRSNAGVGKLTATRT